MSVGLIRGHHHVSVSGMGEGQPHWVVTVVMATNICDIARSPAGGQGQAEVTEDNHRDKVVIYHPNLVIKYILIMI